MYMFFGADAMKIPQSELQGVSRETQPVHDVVFAKTHSTGSSTFCGILHRFCDSHAEAACFVPPASVSCSKTVDDASYLRNVSADAVIKPFTIWPNHVVLMPYEFDRIIPHNVKLSLFREPLSRVQSGFKHEEDVVESVLATLSSLSDDIDVDKCGSDSSHPSSTHVPLKVLDTLDFVMLTEEFDLSLVMLQQRLGWRMSDMVYLPLKYHPVSTSEQRALDQFADYVAKPKSNLTKAARDFVHRCIEGDERQLYQMAQSKFQAQLGSDELRFRSEESKLKKLNENVRDCCSAQEDDGYCRALGEDNVDWVDRQRSGEYFQIGESLSHAGSACYRAATALDD